MIDLKSLNKDRVPIGEVGSNYYGKKVTIAGWLYDDRALGKLRFLVVRDISGEIQITGFKGETPEEVFDKLGKTSRESVVVISGIVKKSDKAPGGREIAPESFEVLAKAENPLPIDVSDFSKTELPKRLDYRFLDFHRRKTQAIFKIQNTIANSFRQFFYNKNFIEMQAPCVISAASEGGTDLFEVKYFEKKAYLAQSPQLYKQMLACSIESAFMITPVWRAEKHNTIRHINEIRQMDIECAFYDQFAIMKLMEDVVRYVVSEVLARNKDDLTLLEINLKVPDAKYLHYDECIEVLQKHKVKINKGDDLSPESEKKLAEIYPNTIVFVHSWPSEIKPFYIMTKDGKPDAEYSEGFDAIYGGIEICSGGQRIHLPDLLIERLKSKGLNPKNFEDYINSFRYGAPPHSGWSIGLERLTGILTKQENIREVTMFPRDRDRLTP
ncbi:aspartate--tRNA(Asn) ligase [Candidatus Pacearchaeota archaeon CG10_big_fil_rev_8_21_14_0_10_31_24]|nr:MAG: aspartate--tRNA(Asn) ligase [Candidatus Pacearchaeota archaeon CG10_big_fil_rev_8_21_14_0_10_31_24]